MELACLIPDLEVLPQGDLTEASECEMDESPDFAECFTDWGEGYQPEWWAETACTSIVL